MNVLVIPEDFRKDQYVLRPIVQAIMSEVGRPHATVRILMDPLLGGVARALDLKVLQEEVLPRYPMVQLFLLLVDRDGQNGRRDSLLGIERQLCFFLGGSKCFIAEAAIEELEVWAMAASQIPNDWAWRDIRGDSHPKENYFEPLIRLLGLEAEPGEGRDTLGKQAGASLRRVMQLCPELEWLKRRIADFVAGQGCRNGSFSPPAQ